MALRLGIGDAFTICKGAVDFCIAINDEPEAVQSVVAEMKLMRTHLKCLERQIGDEKSFVAARPDIAPIIKRSLEPLHKDLSDVTEILRQCPRRPSVHVVDKVRYLVLYKAKLDGFRDKLPAHRESICVIHELIDGESQSERRASTVKLCEIVENHELQQKKQDEYEKAQREVVRIFEERLPSSKNARHLNTSEMLEELENDLVAKGLSREKAGEQLFPITKALLLHPLPQDSNKVPSMQKPSFDFSSESVFHCSSAGDIHQFQRKDSSEYEAIKTFTRGPDAREASAYILSASLDDDDELVLQRISQSRQEATALIPDASQRSKEKPRIDATEPSPASFMMRRRPLLQSGPKSSELFASWTDRNPFAL